MRRAAETHKALDDVEKAIGESERPASDWLAFKLATALCFAVLDVADAIREHARTPR